MKALGLLLLMVGLLFPFLGALLLGDSVYRAFQGREVAAIPITPGRKLTSDPVMLKTDRLAQLSLQLLVESDAVQEETKGDGRRDLALRYQFPLRVVVRDEAGRTLHTSSVTASWDAGFRTIAFNRTSPAGGRMKGRHHFGKFTPPPGGRVVVEAELGQDTVYGARVEEAELILYENVSRQSGRIAGIFFTCCTAPFLLTGGLLLLLMGRGRIEQPA